jgi:hypothetical protein
LGKIAALSAIDRGWFGLRPLQTHVVICGFPRSGSTLLLLMAEACVADARIFGKQVDALAAAKQSLRNHPIMITKTPHDLFFADEIRNYYADRKAKARFIITVRDPRAVLTSINRGRDNDYGLAPERWSSYYEHVQHVTASEDAVVVKYEDLVRRPDEVQGRLTQFIGWNCTCPFDQFHTRVPANFDVRFLNGLRPLDPNTIQSWRHERNRARLQQVLRELPELPDRLIEMGYESDTSWTGDYDAQPITLPT